MKRLIKRTLPRVLHFFHWRAMLHSGFTRRRFGSNSSRKFREAAMVRGATFHLTERESTIYYVMKYLTVESGCVVELGLRSVRKLPRDGAAAIYASSYTSGQSTVQ